ncbi:MAG: prepilin peptidase [Sphingobacteriia bacterium]|nr:prepilin peptidase [Sphingobacteriia bacterium]
MLNENFIVILLILSGAILGSFISLITYRLPRGKEITFKRSNCPKCKQNLSFIQLIPILGFLLQKGKCKNCKKSISLRYLIIEIFTVCILFLSYKINGEYFILYSTIYLILFCMIITDLETLSVPNIFQIILLPLILIVTYIKNLNFISQFFTSLFVVLMMYLICLGFKKFTGKKDILGMADIKFMAIAALAIPSLYIPQFFFFSGLLGIMLGGIWKYFFKKQRFPFIPALAFSLLICLNNCNIVQNLIIMAL